MGGLSDTRLRWAWPVTCCMPDRLHPTGQGEHFAHQVDHIPRPSQRHSPELGENLSTGSFESEHRVQQPAAADMASGRSAVLKDRRAATTDMF
jgi:hypothetical protein